MNRNPSLIALGSNKCGVQIESFSPTTAPRFDNDIYTPLTLATIAAQYRRNQAFRSLTSKEVLAMPTSARSARKGSRHPKPSSANILSWASRALSGPIVESNLPNAADDLPALTLLPSRSHQSSRLNVPDEVALNMCSVDSTTTCPSTTWCQSTTACPSTTNCPSVQTCLIQDASTNLGASESDMNAG
ncbi:MAG: hypothetical protein ACXWCP_22120, partial [Burkholderiales bacterium]